LSFEGVGVIESIELIEKDVNLLFDSLAKRVPKATHGWSMRVTQKDRMYFIRVEKKADERCAGHDH
jgi:hypothetical protein